MVVRTAFNSARFRPSAPLCATESSAPLVCMRTFAFRRTRQAPRIGVLWYHVLPLPPLTAKLMFRFFSLLISRRFPLSCSVVPPQIASMGRANKAKAREYKASGNKAMAAGSFQKAMRQYTKALELDPGNAILYSNRSATHFNLRQFAESLEDAESAILCDEKWWKAYKRKGLALIHMQRYDEAIEALEAGLQIIGKNAEMEKNLEFAKACQEQAQNLYILPEPHMMERLESVPVFIVTDEAGQPFFVTYEDGQQVCTFYFDKVDADATLKWIQEENPDIGTSARVIHITLNQAFTLAQETQKQYYEETTRAAVEEDLAAARAAAGKGKKGRSEQANDVDGDEEDVQEGTNVSEPVRVGESADVPQKETGDDVAEGLDGKSREESDGKSEEENIDDTEAESEDKPDANVTSTEVLVKSDADAKAISGENDDEADPIDDSILDENAPLSFQFRPELRQVEVAVELLNKNPNPPVRPILRDPAAVKEAKAKAKAKAEVEEGDTDLKVEGPADSGMQKAAACSESSTDPAPETACDNEKAAESEKNEIVVSAVEEVDLSISVQNEADSDENSKSGDKAVVDDDDDVELTVENFNGIPVFQAKGLTLLQNGKQHIPLFCSKWDLEAAWDQLAASSTAGISGKCEVEVGTLEDVLRRMSESKTGEYENVIFVPSREAMDAIGQKFPLDDLSTRKPAPKPVVKKANYSRAKQIKARGGTPEEIRAAIEEDLKLYRERQRMAEMVAQLNQTPAFEQATSAAGRNASAAAAARRGAPVEKPLSGHSRRNMQREERNKSSSGKQTATEIAKPRFSDVKAPAAGTVPSSHVKESSIDASIARPSS
jgi:tetratricopeptide (TPR) repeat protein